VVHWSVSAQASGDRELSREEIVELADAVAPAGGVASGIGQTAYGAQLLVEAETRESALERGASIFTAAAGPGGRAPGARSALSARSEDEDEDDGP
jgi:hypothetical protein